MSIKQEYTKKILKGMMFQHYKNKETYVIMGACKIQEDDVWVDAVIYSNAFKVDKDQFGDQVKYVRSEKEFRSKFRG